MFEWICWRVWFSWATTVYKFMIRFMFAFRFVFQFLLLREKMFIEIIRNRNTHRMSHRHHHQSFQWWRVHVCVYVYTYGGSPRGEGIFVILISFRDLPTRSISILHGGFHWHKLIVCIDYTVNSNLWTVKNGYRWKRLFPFIFSWKYRK